MSNKMKFAIPTVLVLGLMLSFTLAFAQNTTEKEDKGTDTSTTATINKSVAADKVCVTSARTARVAAVKTASDTAKAARADAKTKRDTALKDAKANTDKKVRAAGVKAANAAYKASIKDIAKTLTDSTKTAWSDYATAVKACPKKTK